MKVHAQKQPQQQSSPSGKRSRAKPLAASPLVDSILYLQRTIGNQAVLRLLRANTEGVEVGSDTPAKPHLAPDCSQIPVHSKAPINLQAKLTVNTPGDSLEQEADRVSEQVMRITEPQLKRACACGGGCPTCQNVPADKEHLQTKSVQANDTRESAAPPIVNEVLHSSGQSLDTSTREFMESRFDHDFSQVRVHTDAKAADSALSINALAYTVGKDVVFGAQQYRPETAAGKKLLAHELTHTLQQGNTIIRRQPVINAGTGTTAELKKELERLKREHSEASKKCGRPTPSMTVLRVIQSEYAYATCPPEVQQELKRYDPLIEKLQSRIAERGDTKLKGCGLKLSFNGSALQLSGELNQSIPAVSGKPVNGKFDYSEERQKIEKTGPIPEGNYWINPDELKSLWYYPSQWLPGVAQVLPNAQGAQRWVQNVAPNAWGTHRITIHPYDQTKTFGRGGFFIHGGAIPGSAGCIDLTDKISEFAAILKQFENCKIPLSVSYPQIDKSKEKN